MFKIYILAHVYGCLRLVTFVIIFKGLCFLLVYNMNVEAILKSLIQHKKYGIRMQQCEYSMKT